MFSLDFGLHWIQIKLAVTAHSSFNALQCTECCVSSLPLLRLLIRRVFTRLYCCVYHCIAPCVLLRASVAAYFYTLLLCVLSTVQLEIRLQISPNNSAFTAKCLLAESRVEIRCKLAGSLISKCCCCCCSGRKQGGNIHNLD